MGSLDAAQQFMSQDDPALAEKAGEKAHDADKDQIERDDYIQQTGHYENQNARDERHQWSDSKFWHETFPSGLNTVYRSWNAAFQTRAVQRSTEHTNRFIR